MPSVNTTNGTDTRDPIRVLQLKVHRSEKGMISLFNTHSTRSFHFLLIQEPHINMFSHLPMTDPNWHMMTPLMTNPPSLTGDACIKSVIYINNQLPSHSFAAVETNTPLIAGITVSLPLPHPPLHILSAYLPPKHPQEMCQP